MTTPAQRAARSRFADERRRITAADRRLHVAPPRSVAVLFGYRECHDCGRRIAGDVVDLRPDPAAGRVWYVHPGDCPPAEPPAPQPAV